MQNVNRTAHTTTARTSRDANAQETNAARAPHRSEREREQNGGETGRAAEIIVDRCVALGGKYAPTYRL